MPSCRPASVRSDHTSTCRRVGGTMRANDTVSRCIDSTTGTLFATVGHGGHHPSTFAGGASASRPSTSRPSLASMTRDRPVTTQEETTQHVCQVTSTPAAPVGCAIPPPTTHPGCPVQPRERLSPGCLALRMLELDSAALPYDFAAGLMLADARTA